jgi:glutathione S-transferase
MKLYYSPGACSLGPHIVLNELGSPYEVEKVDLAAKKTEKGADYWQINPKGYVPAIVTDDGQLVSEAGVVLQYLADRKPEANLLPKNGTIERVRAQEWLNFITSEIHKGYSPLFRPTTPDAYKAIARENLGKRLAYVDKHLAGKKFMLGDNFSVIDAYLFNVVRWSQFTQVDLSPYANLNAFMERVLARPKVQETLKQEGLLK